MIFSILSWGMSIIALLGTILNAERNKIGFYFWFISNIYMTIVDFQAGLYAQSALFLVYTILAIRGMFVWTKKEDTNNNTENEQEVEIIRVFCGNCHEDIEYNDKKCKHCGSNKIYTIIKDK